MSHIEEVDDIVCRVNYIAAAFSNNDQAEALICLGNLQAFLSAYLLKLQEEK